MAEDQAQQERRHYLRRNADQMQDEISLIDLYQVLVRRKQIIFITLAVIITLSIVYLLVASKVYQVSAMLLEPTADQLALTNRTVVNPNVDAENTKPLFIPEEVFKAYTIELKKKETWNRFVAANSELFNDDPDDHVSDRSINNPLVVTDDKDFPGPHILIKYKSGDKNKAGQVLTHYLKFSKHEFTLHQIRIHKQKVEQKVAALELKIKASRSNGKIKREDEIVRLQSDLAIAKKLNIKDNRMLAVQDKTSLTVVASNLDVPRYMRGTKVLEAELEALKNRNSDDAFINGLRGWQQEVSRLKLIEYEPERFEPYILDGQINDPESPIKPKVSLVLALAIVLGLFLGVFVAFFFEFIKKAGQSGR